MKRQRKSQKKTWFKKACSYMIGEKLTLTERKKGNWGNKGEEGFNLATVKGNAGFGAGEGASKGGG